MSREEHIREGYLLLVVVAGSVVGMVAYFLELAGAL
jgi:hypothetical protein